MIQNMIPCKFSLVVTAINNIIAEEAIKLIITPINSIFWIRKRPCLMLRV